jgi:hypothetical protein
MGKKTRHDNRPKDNLRTIIVCSTTQALPTKALTAVSAYTNTNAYTQPHTDTYMHSITDMQHNAPLYLRLASNASYKALHLHLSLSLTHTHSHTHTNAYNAYTDTDTHMHRQHTHAARTTHHHVCGSPRALPTRHYTASTVKHWDGVHGHLHKHAS